MKPRIPSSAKISGLAPAGRTAGRRRALIACVVAVAAPGIAVAQFRSGRSGPLVEVWKSPTCGCCKDWIAHMEANGFRVDVDDSGNAAARARLGIAQKFGSCHTALVDGYAIEGHVPASEVRRLLEERPEAVGLAVPGMPIGSPGMDGPAYGGRQHPYDVLLVQADGTSSVYRSYR
ncbi:MAG: DUF411 domain-containing protein [Limnobacter sp.]|nr:DUF411 domain-containing protein [Limnobacter sp.]